MPLVGSLIDRAHVEPLHLKNNACALTHRYLLNHAIKISHLSDTVTQFSHVPPSCPFGKYIKAMRTKCKLSRLANQVVRWFNETKASGREFDYRFTGRDSRFFLHNFMVLVSCLENAVKKDSQEEAILHVLAYVCLSLRESVALFTRVDISDSEVGKIKQYCLAFFKAHSLFLSRVNPTVWTLGHIVPAHLSEMKRVYGFGLGLNSMEGREAKHVFIKKYFANTLHQCRWEQIFRHEYVTLIWLRERGHNMSPKQSRKLSYIPNRCTGNPTICYCGLDKDATAEECRFCSHQLRNKIQTCILNNSNKYLSFSVRF